MSNNDDKNKPNDKAKNQTPAIIRRSSERSTSSRNQKPANVNENQSRQPLAAKRGRSQRIPNPNDFEHPSNNQENVPMNKELLSNMESFPANPPPAIAGPSRITANNQQPNKSRNYSQSSSKARNFGSSRSFSKSRNFDSSRSGSARFTRSMYQSRREESPATKRMSRWNSNYTASPYLPTPNIREPYCLAGLNDDPSDWEWNSSEVRKLMQQTEDDKKMFNKCYVNQRIIQITFTSESIDVVYEDQSFSRISYTAFEIVINKELASPFLRIDGQSTILQHSFTFSEWSGFLFIVHEIKFTGIMLSSLIHRISECLNVETRTLSIVCREIIGELLFPEILDTITAQLQTIMIESSELTNGFIDDLEVLISFQHRQRSLLNVTIFTGGFPRETSFISIIQGIDRAFHHGTTIVIFTDHQPENQAMQILLHQSFQRFSSFISNNRRYMRMIRQNRTRCTVIIAFIE